MKDPTLSLLTLKSSVKPNTQVLLLPSIVTPTSFSFHLLYTKELLTPRTYGRDLTDVGLGTQT